MCGTATADVQSANVVGYTTKTCTAGQWYMIGCGFENVSGGALDIQKFISGLTARGSANNPAFIQVWNGVDLDTYQYTQYFDLTSYTMKDGWVKAGEAQPAVLPIQPGFTCWFKDPAADATITIAGQVVTASSSPITTEASEWIMVANPYPIATTLNNGLIDWSNFTARASAQTPDFIQFWNGTDLDTYQYTQYFDLTSYTMKDGWVKAGEAQPTTLEIPAGTGFWFKSYTGGDIIFKKSAN